METRECEWCKRQHKDLRRKLCGSCRVKKYRQNVKQKAIDMFGGKCSKCGYSKCNAALQFHHLDPTQKEIKISAPNNKSWEKVKEELKKCILVCANCHAEIHDK